MARAPAASVRGPARIGRGSWFVSCEAPPGDGHIRALCVGPQTQDNRTALFAHAVPHTENTQADVVMLVGPPPEEWSLYGDGPLEQ